MSANFCFKCGREFRKDDKVVFSTEWDAFCHTECCPALSKNKVVDEECSVCEVYLLSKTRQLTT